MNDMPPLHATKPLVLDLLTYIEEVEKLKAKPAFSVPTDAFVAWQHELLGLPEIQFNLQRDTDDIWLSIPRLKEISAPELDEKLAPWVTLPKSPEKTPELKSERIILDGKQEVSRAKLTDQPGITELFDWYVENQWRPWAVAEMPRRKVIGFYNRLFALQQTISLEGVEAPVELVWGIGYATWKKLGFATHLRHPLLVQSCEIHLNEETFNIEIRPRDVDPYLEVDTYAEMDVPGVRQLEAFWKNAKESGASRVNPFDTSSFEGILHAAVGYLDPTGIFDTLTDNLEPPVPDNKLKITDTWVIFARKRSGHIFLQDVQRLKKSVETALDLPVVIRSFVEYVDSTVRVKPEQSFRGLSSSEGTAGAKELCFPMPYNDEQVAIVQKLENNDGVVVQGPPGTGKTHTIANVICHYLAQGKRVLVTANGETALSVLQEKIPEGIRPLTVSLLSSERDGMKQFEHSIQKIADSVSSLNPAQANIKISELEQKLNQLHTKIARIDQSIAGHAAQHMRNYTFMGKEISPEELAKEVIAKRDTYQWFDDRPPQDEHLPFDEKAIKELRRARIGVGKDLNYLTCRLPTLAEFPTWTDLMGVHRDLARARDIEQSVLRGDIFPLVDARAETIERAQKLAAFIEGYMALKAKVNAIRKPWHEALGKRIVDMSAEDPLWQALEAVCEESLGLEKERQTLLTQAIELPAGAELNEDFKGAVARLIEGKSAFALSIGKFLLPFGKSEAHGLIGSVTVMGGAPSTKAEWELVRRLMEWRTQVRKLLARWNALSGEFELEPANGALESSFKAIVLAQSQIRDVYRLVTEFDAQFRDRLAEVFDQQATDSLWAKEESCLTQAALSLVAHLDKNRLAYAQKRILEIVRKLDGMSGAIVDEIKNFLSYTIGRSELDESQLQPIWNKLLTELARLVDLYPLFDIISKTAYMIEEAGAPKWSARIRSEPTETDHDPMLPAQWFEAWRWRQADMLLEQMDAHQELRKLFEERKTETTVLARTYQELVAEKTWLGVFNNSPDNVRQALQTYLNAVQAMGAGTGVRAIRHRKAARDAMTRAYQAVPCWVLPQWRVSETIPPEIGLFDLVIVDEASQSDIWAFPTLLRGKKILVVGDHKQVSPSAVGMAEEKIKGLMSRFLSQQPHKDQMTPDKSIYDLARVVFAGNSVMLKEHFRCVPAIIEFSNREFYEGDIKPLRLPKANERLDPPLVDVFVKGGTRKGGGNQKGDVNRAEAKAIVDEIEAILADEQFNGRSIGVVTLMGIAQAAHIQELVSRRISPSDVLARKIAVGPPPVFQGRERDIMMVSMVLEQGDRATQNKLEMEQRFNVALSRARDRMYLFRSVHETTFREDTLNARVIRHFRQPFRQDAQKIETLRQKCESGFEREMFDELVKRDYRVQPQVQCGGYRIDFVVEGSEGRRLAIECDGDRFHGPDQWSHDMTRQRVLERAGWTFWRCFASSFVRHRQEVISDLLQTLGQLGIEPLGAETVDNSVWVHSKEVDPFGVEEPEMEDNA